MLKFLIDNMVKKNDPAKPAASSHGAAHGTATAAIMARARKYLAEVPGAIEGSNGSGQTMSVCVHLRGFGLDDNEMYELLSGDYNARCVPPWSEKELWHKIKSVKPRDAFHLNETKRPGSPPIKNEWDGLGDGIEAHAPSKRGGRKDKGGIDDVIRILSTDARIAGSLTFDELKGHIAVCGKLPFKRTGSTIWSDDDDTAAQEWLAVEWDLTVGVDIVTRAVTRVARLNGTHPIKDYLGALKWDGVPRCNEWLITVFSAADTAYARTVGPAWLISAVARVLRPGCQVDHALILEGAQRTGKSSALRILCGDDWFTDELPEMGTKDAASHVQGSWIVELGELDTLNRSEVSAVKAFITRRVDKYRPAYGRHSVEQKRSCVFAGTVNPGANGYLRDETGNGRWWPVACGVVDLRWLRENRDQLWAEALARYKAEEKWHITDLAVLAEATEVQAERAWHDEWEDKIKEWMIGRDETTILEVAERVFGIPPGKVDHGTHMRLGRCLLKAGLEKFRPASQVGRVRVYRKRPA